MAKPHTFAAQPDPLVEHYLRDVDRTLLRRNLTLSPEERLVQLQELARFAEELRRVGVQATTANAVTDFRALILEAIAELRALLDEGSAKK